MQRKPEEEFVHEDHLLLECLEELLRTVNNSIAKVQQIRSVHVRRLQQWASEIEDQRRMIEDISVPARIILEHILECKDKGAQVAVEAGLLTTGAVSVRKVKVKKFGVIEVTLGELVLAWRDSDYKYYFYPDKIELRAMDEKSAIKLFFSLAFSRQLVTKFPQLLQCANVAYVHPQIEQWLRKGTAYESSE